jgi:hypothetical protein
MAIQTCPHCQTISEADATRCDCGYDYRTGETPFVRQEALSQAASSRIAVIGLCCLPSVLAGLHYGRVLLASARDSSADEGGPYSVGPEGWWVLYSIVVSGLPTFGWLSLILGVAAGAPLLMGRQASPYQRLFVGVVLAVAFAGQLLSLGVLSASVRSSDRKGRSSRNRGAAEQGVEADKAWQDWSFAA